MKRVLALALCLHFPACAGTQAHDSAPVVPSEPPPAMPALCGPEGIVDAGRYSFTFAHPPSPTSSTHVDVEATVDSIRWSQDYRGDEGRVESVSELVCVGPGWALGAYSEDGISWRFDPPLTVLVADTAEGAAEGVVHVVDATGDRELPYVHAWSSEAVDPAGITLIGVTLDRAVVVRSVLYLGDASEPAQLSATTWAIGDSMVFVVERESWHAETLRIDQASRVEQTE